jgi:hypothetical protein
MLPCYCMSDIEFMQVAFLKRAMTPHSMSCLASGPLWRERYQRFRDVGHQYRQPSELLSTIIESFSCVALARGFETGL